MVTSRNGSEPWKIPKVKDLKPIDVKFEKPSKTGKWNIYHTQRDKETLSRLPGDTRTAGLQHRVGGLEKAEDSGHVSYDPENHHRMVELRQEKEIVQNDIDPKAEIYGKNNGDFINYQLGWNLWFLQVCCRNFT